MEHRNRCSYIYVRKRLIVRLMKKFLIIFIASVFFIAFVISMCNGDDLENTGEKPTSYSEKSSSNFEIPTSQEQERADTVHVSVSKFESSALEIPYLTTSKPEQILCRIGYTTSYNNITKNANWVAWHLTKEHTTGPWSRKGIPYMVDTEIKGARQELEDWYNHGLPIGHGHMCPAGDNKWNEEAMVQTFLLSNMCPQNSKLNNGDWKYLEERCRGWANHYGEVYIVCGPIFYSQNYKTIGANNVGVPDAFYKVVLRMGKKPQALGFIYPNEGMHHKMSYYVHSVDDVESQTGIDFFYNLPDDIENEIEAESRLEIW